MAKPRVRDNFGKFQKYATVNITKQLQSIADEHEVIISKIVKDKLLKTYKENVLASYSPRSEKGIEVQEYNEYQKKREEKEHRRFHKKKLTYRHTGTFLRAIKAIKKGKTVKIVIDGAATYEDGTPVTKVYEYLTKGTSGGEETYAYKTKNGITGGRNYPTPEHNFEEWTQVQMLGFLNSLEADIKNGKYYTKRYLKKGVR